MHYLVQISITSLFVLSFMCVLTFAFYNDAPHLRHSKAMTSSRYERDVGDHRHLSPEERNRAKEQRRLGRESKERKNRRKIPKRLRTTTTTTPSPANRHIDDEPPVDVAQQPSEEIQIYPNATENPCPPCHAMREQRRLLRIQMIKDDLLRKLKMDEPPQLNRTRNMTLLPFHISMPPQQPSARHGTDGFKNLIFGEPPPQISYIRAHSPDDADFDHNKIAFFNLDDEVLRSTLHKAHLLLYIRDFVAPSGFNHLRIYKLSNDSTGRINIPTTPSMKHKIYFDEEGQTGGWLNISFKEIAEDWVRRPSDNFGILITLDDFHARNLVVMDYDAAEDEVDMTPLLQLDMTERDSGRSKRRQPDQMTCLEGSKETRCCRYPLIIDFDEFGWEWILQPRQYPAFYCAGECPLSFYPNSAHSHVVSLQKDSSLPGGPCCTPVKMLSMSMIYYDDSMVIKQRVLEDMVVETCGCN